MSAYIMIELKKSTWRMTYAHIYMFKFIHSWSPLVLLLLLLDFGVLGFPVLTM